jgi:hypothetical protein
MDGDLKGGEKILIAEIDRVIRWVWSKDKWGNIIQRYVKKLHFYHRKVLEEYAWLRPLTWEEYRQL